MLDPTLFARPWEIPALTSMNRLRGRADLVPYPTAAAALKRDPRKSKWFLSLDGKWSVSFHEKVEVIIPLRAVIKIRVHGKTHHVAVPVL